MLEKKASVKTGRIDLVPPRMADSILAMYSFINFALDTRKTLVEGGFRFLTDFTCQVIQSFQDFLFSGEIKGKIVKSLVQIDIWDEDLGGGGGHGNSGWKEALAINL